MTLLKLFHLSEIIPYENALIKITAFDCVFASVMLISFIFKFKSQKQPY